MSMNNPGKEEAHGQYTSGRDAQASSGGQPLRKELSFKILLGAMFPPAHMQLQIHASPHAFTCT
jgi:hypothetical protein